MPIGTLSQKIHCQEIPSTTAPPTSGPKAIARPPIPPQAPSARPRFSAGTAALRSVRVSGITIAPPSPWAARARLSASDGRSERRGDRAEREDREPDREHPPAPEPVAQRGTRQQQHGEGERVRVDRPFEVLERRAEVRADHGHRGRDDEVVERDHEQRDRGDHECPDRSCAGVICSPPSSVVISHSH